MCTFFYVKGLYEVPLPVLDIKPSRGQKRSSNRIDGIDVERNGNNCLCIRLTCQPERG